jgi:phospholipid transport system substrate-binding protein
MPYVDYRFAAYKVIGIHFKKTKKEDRLAFVPVFRDSLISTYAQVFTLYDNQKVEFLPAKSFEGKKDVAVKVSVIEPGRDPIDITFKARKNKKTNEWKVYDMVPLGNSLLTSKQKELSGLIRQKGLAHVTTLLKKKSEGDIVFK